MARRDLRRTDRRQELLRRRRQLRRPLRDYERARAAGAPLRRCPSLLIICDEFSELLSAKPDFIDMFVQIGRLGRSLGVHLLLGLAAPGRGPTARSGHAPVVPDRAADVLREESRVVLGVARRVRTAARARSRLPEVGHRAADPVPRGLRVRHVPRAADSAAAVGLATDIGPGARSTRPQYVAPRPVPEETETETPPPDEDTIGETLLDILVERVEGQGTPAHQMWLPPLDDPADARPVAAAAHHRPATSASPSVGADLRGALRVPVGIVDRPREQRRDGHDARPVRCRRPRWPWSAARRAARARCCARWSRASR